jgi:hypothetical protein
LPNHQLDLAADGTQAQGNVIGDGDLVPDPTTIYQGEASLEVGKLTAKSSDHPAQVWHGKRLE